MLHMAEFEAIIQQSASKTIGGCSVRWQPPLPFGFVFAPRLEKGSQYSYLFIVAG